jgi:predicted RecB family nuclease
MDRMREITDAIFAASLLCQTKAYLLHAREAGYPDELSCLERDLSAKYRRHAQEILQTNIPEHNQHKGMPPDPLLTTNRYFLILNPYLCSKDIVSQPDALVRISKATGLGAYTPVRYLRNEKIADIDRLILAFDAIVLSNGHKIATHMGRIIHGPQYTSSTVSLSKWLPKAQSQLNGLTVKIDNQEPPPPVLNKHCPACEFRDRCRGIATNQDDLSLLGNMRPKDRLELFNKGIFTVTQLSYTYRARRRRRKTNRTASTKHDPALKALAIRKGIAHVLGEPEFTISRPRAVYIDVEGVPGSDFYYLVGIRLDNGDKAIQHTFWADTPNDEGELWASIVGLLKSIDNPQIVHYGSYETHYFRRMKERYSLHDATLERILCSAVNLLAITYAHVYFPTYTNGLKDIARHLGFEWSDKNASGRSALSWRLKWEETQDPSLKARLLAYNTEDCKALEIAATAIAKICVGRSLDSPNTFIDVKSLETDRPLRFGPLQYAVPAYKQINEAAYWNYQRSKIYIRSSERLKSIARLERRTPKQPPINKTIQPVLNRPAVCPKCSLGKMYRNGIYSHLIHDVRFVKGGARRWVVRQRFYRYHCRKCKTGHNALPRQKRTGAGLRAYVVFSVIELRIAQRAVARMMGTLFGFHMTPTAVNSIKIDATQHYQETYRSILRQIVGGPLVHADETQVTVKGRTHYVWVFTNLEQVAYVYSESREASTVREVLAKFKGILVSDFYSAYDSVDCVQQKCLIHLLRDINEDLLKAPFNDEMAQLATAFGCLMQPIIQTIDRFGLKARHLRKHRGAVNGFYKMLAGREYETEVAAAYKKRFEKNRSKLFTFLDFDDVPWNNNNAEHAIKAFARLRNVMGAMTTPKGIQEYLVLLSIAETCKYRGASFFEFLRSGHVDLEAFERGKSRARAREATRMQRGSHAVTGTPHQW